jgi:outer membrane lipoprotein-sorting protein
MTCKKSSSESQIIWVQEGSQKLMRLLCTDETGSEKYNVQYFYGGQSALPEKLVIRLANGSTALTVTYSDVRVEKTKDLSVFNLTAPSDVEQNILE